MLARPLIVAGLAALVFTGRPVSAQELADSYPSRPIHFIVPFGPGGGPDIIARRLALGLSEKAKQPVVIDNKPGATGLIGMQELARSKPRRLHHLSDQSWRHGGPGALPRRAGQSGARHHRGGDAVSPVHGSGGGAFAAGAQCQGTGRIPEGAAELSLAGSGGNGTPAHLAGEIFRRSAGFNATHVPYKQLTTALSDVIRGEIQYIFSIGSSAVPMAQSGRLRALAVAAPKRLAVLPDVPTMAESGFVDPDVNSWSGIIAPPGTPVPIVQKLNRLMREVVHDPAHGERLRGARA